MRACMFTLLCFMASCLCSFSEPVPQEPVPLQESAAVDAPNPEASVEETMSAEGAAERLLADLEEEEYDAEADDEEEYAGLDYNELDEEDEDAEVEYDESDEEGEEYDAESDEEYDELEESEYEEDEEADEDEEYDELEESEYTEDEDEEDDEAEYESEE
eukprot:TRINITY_DN30818_c0_g1_i1.p3 TRINITY_DN30818_c0_g1~~TRINITY_DN30818_c0_g1_i1.p3  ORF type:complete len:160 (-),score=69.65 TRINITY_DN30818_c0_g1_i1:287-766(-)